MMIWNPTFLSPSDVAGDDRWFPILGLQLPACVGAAPETDPGLMWSMPPVLVCGGLEKRKLSFPAPPDMRSAPAPPSSTSCRCRPKSYRWPVWPPKGFPFVFRTPHSAPVTAID
ncbi:hypothetical protein FQR65_LT20442 [Abscondita terminalis]|nr:hypothetical protein FQR65_LT20442 [Abscondita terminalis]